MCDCCAVHFIRWSSTPPILSQGNTRIHVAAVLLIHAHVRVRLSLLPHLSFPIQRISVRLLSLLVCSAC